MGCLAACSPHDPGKGASCTWQGHHLVFAKGFFACRTVGQWNCDYFDDIKSLKGFGDANKEGLAELVWAFFEYWAWRHDYNNSVISIRTGGFLTKSQKEWTRRVGNERHLVCIEVSCCRHFAFACCTNHSGNASYLFLCLLTCFVKACLHPAHAIHLCLCVC